MSESQNTSRAKALVSACQRAGVTHFYIAPGSRSTPLVAALVAAEVPIHVVVDERSAAYAALGTSKAGGMGAVVTTSGTAVANLLPACVEAFHDEVAMVVLSADRPLRELDRGANQTVNQFAFLRSASQAFVDIPIGAFNDNVLDEVGEALGLLRSSTPGPVHINVRFDKPLEPLEEPDVHIELPETKRIVDDDTTATWDVILTRLAYSRAGIVVFGGLPYSERQGAERLATLLPWPIFADATSQLSRRPDLSVYRPSLFRSPTFRKHLDCDLILWIGGRLCDPSLAAWAKDKGVDVVQVKPFTRRRDADGIMAESLSMPLSAFAQSLTNAPLANSEILDMVHQAASCAAEAPEELSEVSVASLVCELSNSDELLFVGNSMPIRDVDRFAHELDVPVICNRGASGIDGNISTALGAALASGKRVTALVGDLTALHDVGALLTLSQSQADVRVVVVNNGGGGIFGFLPIAKHPALFEPYFETPHEVNFAKVASSFGLSAARANNETELHAMLSKTISGVSVIEVVTRRDENVALHQKLDEVQEEAMRQHFAGSQKNRRTSSDA